MVRVHLTISLLSECIKEELPCELLKKITIMRGETIYGRQVKGREGNKEREGGQWTRKDIIRETFSWFLLFFLWTPGILVQASASL